MKTSEVLNKAADHLQREGWAQGTGWVGEGPDPTCAANAIWYVVAQDSTAATPARLALTAYIGVRYWPDIFDWNDAPERTAAEVIEVLRACAVIEAAREDQDAAEATYADNLAAVSA